MLGCRGSRPVSGIHCQQFGGATSCYIIKADRHAIVLDCGTGLYDAGPFLEGCTHIDILLTHAPASGLNDGTDKAHKGFQVFNDLMDQYQPKWFIHGHMHLNYGANLPRVCTRGSTTVINATERYEFEIPDPVQVPKRKLFGWG